MAITAKIFRCVILGAPASGKGTISKYIVDNYGFSHIAPGDILRVNIKHGTKLGNKAKEYIDEGRLVPDDLIIKCVLSRLSEVGNRSWLLDGFPRTVLQAERLHANENIDAVINLNVPIDIIVERIKSRWIHLQSGRVYNLGFNTPKIPFKDDITGEDLVQRDDDKPDIVRKRLEIYAEKTQPVLEFYRNLNLVTEFSGKATNEIWPRIEEFLVGKTLKVERQ